jgi:DNA topoisomerase I
VKVGRFGPYVQLGDAETLPDSDKPRMSSLFKSMEPDTVTLDDALKLLSLPRTVGVDDDGEEITAQNGRYGPYLKKGKETRSLEHEEQLFTITLPEARSILAAPKSYGRRRAAAEPLKTLGPDPVSGGEIVLREGRFGPYVTDGETNASLRKGDTVETLTRARAAELLRDRREQGPARPRRGAKKAGTKKATAKQKAPAKKAASKKSPTKKAAAKKASAGRAAAESPPPSDLDSA